MKSKEELWARRVEARMRVLWWVLLVLVVVVVEGGVEEEGGGGRWSWDVSRMSLNVAGGFGCALFELGSETEEEGEVMVEIGGERGESARMAWSWSCSFTKGSGAQDEAGGIALASMAGGEKAETSNLQSSTTSNSVAPAARA